MTATPNPAFGEEEFDNARARWEALREIERLEHDLVAIERDYHENNRAIGAELWFWREIAFPRDFKRAMEGVARDGWQAYYDLVRADITSFDEAARRTDKELLAIRGIGPVRLGWIRQVLREHDSPVQN
jgi:hypothetical protein